MKRFAMLNLLFVALSAPWFFVGTSAELQIAGLPAWAVYCVCLAACYAVFVAVSLGKLWNRGGEEGGQG